ncbi:MAG: ATP-binding protein [Breznakibacter sp.]
MTAAGRYLSNLISQGEHQQLDFKYAINDSKKIARSIAAFANTDGGRLLIGVKDNGNIVGVYSDEEYYMIEAAAQMYCKPPVPFETKEWHVNGKSVLEIIIAASAQKPVSAPDKDGRFMVYIRVNDQNLLANTVLLKVWRREKQGYGAMFRFEGPERFLIDYLGNHPGITKSKFGRLAAIPLYKAEKILVNMVSANILKMVFTEKHVFYSLNPAYGEEWQKNG